MNRSFRSPRTSAAPASPPLPAEAVLPDQEVLAADAWRSHPAVRRLQPYGAPLRPDEVMAPVGFDAHGFHSGLPPHQMGYAQPGTHVTVNNNGQNYRPWREELGLSFARTIGNFFAWPFRLLGRLFENLLLMGAGVLRMMLMVIVGPTLLFAGINYYQANQDRPATEMAAAIGKDGVKLVGALMGGIWDGIFGDDKPEPAQPAR